MPDGVDVRKVDLSIELQILAFHEQRKAGEETDAEADVETVVPPVATRAPATGAAGRKGPDGDVPAVMPA